MSVSKKGALPDPHMTATVVQVLIPTYRESGEDFLCRLSKDSESAGKRSTGTCPLPDREVASTSMPAAFLRRLLIDSSA
jgi:hypothetical protein